MNLGAIFEAVSLRHAPFCLCKESRHCVYRQLEGQNKETDTDEHTLQKSASSILGSLAGCGAIFQASPEPRHSSLSGLSRSFTALITTFRVHTAVPHLTSRFHQISKCATNNKLCFMLFLFAASFFEILIIYGISLENKKPRS